MNNKPLKQTVLTKFSVTTTHPIVLENGQRCEKLIFDSFAKRILGSHKYAAGFIF